MGLLCVFQAIMCLLLLIDSKLVIKYIPKSGNEEYSKLRAWVTSNIWIFVIVEAALAGAEFLLVSLTCYFVNHKNSYGDDPMLSPLIDEPAGRKEGRKRPGYGA